MLKDLKSSFNKVYKLLGYIRDRYVTLRYVNSLFCASTLDALASALDISKIALFIENIYTFSKNKLKLKIIKITKLVNTTSKRLS
jgi:hypothetical protein